MNNNPTSSNATTSFAQVLNNKGKPLYSINLLLIFLLTSSSFVVLMLKDGISAWLLILVGLLWLFQIAISNPSSLATPFVPLIICLLVLLSINYFVSPDQAATLANIQSLLLAFSFFACVTLFVRTRKQIPLVIIFLVVLAFAIALLGLLTTEWTTRESGIISRIYLAIPKMGETLFGVSINKNTIGGALTFFPPMLLSLLLDKSSFARLCKKLTKNKSFPDWLYKLTVALVIVFVLAVLLLTQSRGAWLGVLLGIYSLLVIKDKRFFWLIPFGILLLVLFVRSSSEGSMLGFLYDLDQGQASSLPARTQIWKDSISIISDFPITGIGLDALSIVYPVYLKSFVLPESVATIHHAHNAIITAALETGIPGMVLYIAMFSCFYFMAWHSYRHARTVNRTIILGLVSGMISHQVFGLLDAFSLGKYLAVTMWFYFAIMTALFVHRRGMIHTHTQKKQHSVTLSAKACLQNMVLGILFWALLSISILLFRQISIYLTLSLALVAGVFLGWFYVKHYLFLVYKESTPHHHHTSSRKEGLANTNPLS